MSVLGRHGRSFWAGHGKRRQGAPNGRPFDRSLAGAWAGWVGVGGGLLVEDQFPVLRQAEAVDLPLVVDLDFIAVCKKPRRSDAPGCAGEGVDLVSVSIGLLRSCPHGPLFDGSSKIRSAEFYVNGRSSGFWLAPRLADGGVDGTRVSRARPGRRMNSLRPCPTQQIPFGGLSRTLQRHPLTRVHRHSQPVGPQGDYLADANGVRPPPGPWATSGNTCRIRIAATLRGIPPEVNLPPIQRSPILPWPARLHRGRGGGI